MHPFIRRKGFLSMLAFFTSAPHGERKLRFEPNRATSFLVVNQVSTCEQSDCAGGRLKERARRTREVRIHKHDPAGRNAAEAADLSSRSL